MDTATLERAKQLEEEIKVLENNLYVALDDRAFKFVWGRGNARDYEIWASKPYDDNPAKTYSEKLFIEVQALIKTITQSIM